MYRLQTYNIYVYVESRKLRKPLKSTAVHIHEWIQIFTKKRKRKKREHFYCKYNDVGGSGGGDGSGGDMRVHIHIVFGRGRFRRAVSFWPFFFLFCALAATITITTTTTTSSPSIYPRIHTSRWWRGTWEAEERRNIVTISVLYTYTRICARSFSQQRKDVIRTCTWWTSFLLPFSVFFFHSK